MGCFAGFFIFDGYFLKGRSLVEVNLPIILATGHETKGAIWFKSNGTRFALEMLGEATLGISRVPLNDTCANGLSKKYFTERRSKIRNLI